MNELNINSLASGGVITNYYCVSRCGHCLYNCSPGRSKKYLDGATAEKIFRRKPSARITCGAFLTATGSIWVAGLWELLVQSIHSTRQSRL